MLRDNRKFKFAVGVTAIVIVMRWLLTGDLLMAFEAARPPAEGETKSLTVISVVGPMLIEACVIIGAAIIAWALKLWDFLARLIDQGPVVAPVQQPEASRNAALASGSQIYSPGITANANAADGTRNVPATNDPRGLMEALARAVVAGDTEAESKLRKEIRRPYLRVELGKSVAAGNWDRAREILAELESMESDSKSATTSRRRSASDAPK